MQSKRGAAQDDKLSAQPRSREKKTLHLDAQVRLFHPRPGQKAACKEIKAFSMQSLLPHSQALPSTLHTFYRKHVSAASRWFQGCFPGVWQLPHQGGADPSQVCAASQVPSAVETGCRETKATLKGIFPIHLALNHSC